MKSKIRRFLPKAIHSHRILFGPIRGKRIVTSWNDYPAAITGQTERHLLDWFRNTIHPGETWLDVGAHYGYTTIALSNFVGEHGRVFSFEPMIPTAGYLQQTKMINRMDNTKVLPFGISSESGINPTSSPVRRGMIDKTIQDFNTQDFFTTSLDWIWPKICNEDEKIHGVKIDVQGMELNVLRGMTRILQKQKPKLVIEFHTGVVRAPIIDILKAHNYSKEGTVFDIGAPAIHSEYEDDVSYIFTV